MKRFQGFVFLVVVLSMVSFVCFGCSTGSETVNNSTKTICVTAQPSDVATTSAPLPADSATVTTTPVVFPTPTVNPTSTPTSSPTLEPVAIWQNMEKPTSLELDCSSGVASMSFLALLDYLPSSAVRGYDQNGSWNGKWLTLPIGYSAKKMKSDSAVIYIISSLIGSNTGSLRATNHNGNLLWDQVLFSNPVDLKLCNDKLWVLDSYENKVKIIDKATGAILCSFAVEHASAMQVIHESDDSQILVIAGENNSYKYRVTSSNNYSSEYVGAVPVQNSDITDMEWLPALGNIPERIVVANNGNSFGEVRIYDIDLNLIRTFTTSQKIRGLKTLWGQKDRIYVLHDLTIEIFEI